MNTHSTIKFKKMSKPDKRYLIVDQPEGFQYKPACGKVEQNGAVTVSGFHMTPDEIDNHGSSYRALDDVFREIEENMKK